MSEAVIVSAVRTAVGRAKRGALANYRPEDMGTVAVGEAAPAARGRAIGLSNMLGTKPVRNAANPATASVRDEPDAAISANPPPSISRPSATS